MRVALRKRQGPACVWSANPNSSWMAFRVWSPKSIYTNEEAQLRHCWELGGPSLHSTLLSWAKHFLMTPSRLEGCMICDNDMWQLAWEWSCDWVVILWPTLQCFRLFDTHVSQDQGMYRQLVLDSWGCFYLYQSQPMHVKLDLCDLCMYVLFLNLGLIWEFVP